MFFFGICTGKEGNAIKDAPPRHIGMSRSDMPMDTALHVFAGIYLIIFRFEYQLLKCGGLTNLLRKREDY